MEIRVRRDDFYNSGELRFNLTLGHGAILGGSGAGSLPGMVSKITSPVGEVNSPRQHQIEPLSPWEGRAFGRYGKTPPL